MERRSGPAVWSLYKSTQRHRTRCVSQCQSQPLICSGSSGWSTANIVRVCHLRSFTSGTVLSKFKSPFFTDICSVGGLVTALLGPLCIPTMQTYFFQSLNMIISTIATASYFKPLYGFPLVKVLEVAPNYSIPSVSLRPLDPPIILTLIQFLYSLFVVSPQGLCTYSSHNL